MDQIELRWVRANGRDKVQFSTNVYGLTVGMKLQYRTVTIVKYHNGMQSVSHGEWTDVPIVDDVQPVSRPKIADPLPPVK